MSEAYRKAGVDIAAGKEVVQRISSAVKKTVRPEVLGGIGGFGALCTIPDKYSQPILVSGADGVGTKLLVAQRQQQHRTIGIDLVAMCVNDIATLGAEPLFFLDYFATGKLAPTVIEDVITGIADACVEAGCALIGGETAEMPGMYQKGQYDLAGFVVGVVEKENMIDGSHIREGDCVIGFSSSGIHSNGYSLVRSICDDLDWNQEYGLGETLGELLLRPTKMYTSLCLSLAEKRLVHGLAHITGGGLTHNIPRILPEGYAVSLAKSAWCFPPIFQFLQEKGKLSWDDMTQTFNCGIGLVAIVPADRAEQVQQEYAGIKLGTVQRAERKEVLWY